MKIIDLSKYNVVTDWQKVKKNCDGVILRIGYRGASAGKIVIDSTFKERVAQVIKLKIPWGIYFVTQALTEQESEQEVVWCIGQIMNLDRTNFQFGIACDSEYYRNRQGRADRLSKNIRTKLVNRFMVKGNLSGYDSYLYCSDSWLDDCLIYNDLEYKSKTWIARYSSIKPSHQFAMWQYTSTGKIDGVKGNVDINKTVNETVKPIVNIPSLKGYKGFSIVGGLKQFGYPSTFEYRKMIATKLGIVNYKGTAKQNTYLLSLLKEK